MNNKVSRLSLCYQNRKEERTDNTYSISAAANDTE